MGSTRTVPAGGVHIPSTLSSLPFLGCCCFITTGGAGGLKGVTFSKSCWLQDPNSYFNSKILLLPVPQSDFVKHRFTLQNLKE